MQELLTIVLPCYNEAENIPSFFPELLTFAQKNNFLVIAVNDGSSDGTAELLAEFANKYPCFTVVTHKLNCGYGAALKTGLLTVKTGFAITIDADGQHRLSDVVKCFECMQDTNADMIVGSRQNNQSGTCRTLGKILIKLFAKSLLKLPVKDLNSGMKCYRMSEAREYLSLCPDTMAFSDVVLLLMANDRKLVLETPIEVLARTTGKSTIGLKSAINTFSEILNLAVLLRPMTTFFRAGLIFVLLGFGWGIFTYVRSTTITPAGVMMIVFGFMCFALGLIGEQLTKIRKMLAKREKI